MLSIFCLKYDIMNTETNRIVAVFGSFLITHSVGSIADIYVTASCLHYLPSISFTGGAVALPCVNSHWLSQWEPFIFDPPQNRRPLTDR